MAAMSRLTVVVAIVACALVAGATFLLGRATAPSTPRKSDPAGTYLDGLRAGEAQGLQDGRALQEGAALPAGEKKVAQHAFDAGYVAGMNDVFAGYDGGWTGPSPWIITLTAGTGQVTYRIHSRERLEPKIDYYLCPDGHSVCRRPHH